MSNKDKLFQVIHTNGTVVLNYYSLELAKAHARTLNQIALDNGRLDRYLAIQNPDTPQEEL
ncbi:hypothetical protein LCGC14_1888940 [marine sediment metagenome]|uniref:Uncharacterized protein n=1 Tax=marine sediment metagenome TaxID=412755 RepID=A0A0F9G091_9ZZZZ